MISKKEALNTTNPVLLSVLVSTYSIALSNIVLRMHVSSYLTQSKLTTRLTTISCPLQCTPRAWNTSERKWAQPDSHTGKRQYTKQESTPKSVRSRKETTGKSIRMVSLHRNSHQSKRNHQHYETLKRAACKPVLAVTTDGAALERTIHLRYVRILYIKKKKLSYG